MGVLRSVESKYGYRCDYEPLLSLIVVHAALKNVTLILYKHSIDKLDEQNIFNLK